MKNEKKRKDGAEKEREKKRKKLHDIAAKCMNIQEVFEKVNFSVGSQTKSVNSAMHELDQGCATFFVGGPYNQLQTSSGPHEKLSFFHVHNKLNNSHKAKLDLFNILVGHLKFPVLA